MEIRIGGEIMSWYKMSKAKSYYTIQTARTTQNPEILAKILQNEKDDEVSRYAARNPNCPPEILEGILKRSKNNFYISGCAVMNPNFPTETLLEILKRGPSDRLFPSAIYNPKCPPEMKIKWMRENGVITQENPSKHIIDEGEKVVEDKELDEFRKLISMNNQMVKTSQNYYSDDIAFTTKDPKILAEILRRGKSDMVSIWAAQNPNCPPEILAEVLRRGNNDDVSGYAASNLNCPPEILAEILERERHDIISKHAAMNKNCPIIPKLKWLSELVGEPFPPNNPYNLSKEDGKLIVEERKKLREIDNIGNIDIENFQKMLSNDPQLIKIAQAAFETFGIEDKITNSFVKNYNAFLRGDIRKLQRDLDTQKSIVFGSMRTKNLFDPVIAKYDIPQTPLPEEIHFVIMSKQHPAVINNSTKHFFVIDKGNYYIGRVMEKVNEFEPDDEFKIKIYHETQHLLHSLYSGETEPDYNNTRDGDIEYYKDKWEIQSFAAQVARTAIEDIKELYAYRIRKMDPIEIKHLIDKMRSNKDEFINKHFVNKLQGFFQNKEMSSETRQRYYMTTLRNFGKEFDNFLNELEESNFTA